MNAEKYLEYVSLVGVHVLTSDLSKAKVYTDGNVARRLANEWNKNFIQHSRNYPWTTRLIKTTSTLSHLQK